MLEVRTTGHEDDDFDLFLFDPEGRLVASATSPGPDESNTYPVPIAGVYTVSVSASFAFGEFSASAVLS